MFTFDIRSDKAEEVVRLLEAIRAVSYEKFQIQTNLVAEGDGTLLTILPGRSKLVFRDYGTPIEREIAELLEKLGVDLKDPNYEETPKRVAAYFVSHFRSDDRVGVEIEEMRRKVFPSNYTGIITVGPTQAYGMCPHHLLPVIYSVTVGYIPRGHVIGLSKLSRVPKLLALRPDLQEDFTHNIARIFSELLSTEDVAVLVEGQHQCMQVRGVEEDGALTTTSVMWGRFMEDEGGCKSEFFRIVDRQRK